jgi:hypothetical protein
MLWRNRGVGAEVSSGSTAGRGRQASEELFDFHQVNVGERVTPRLSGVLRCYYHSQSVLHWGEARKAASSKIYPDLTRSISGHVKQARGTYRAENRSYGPSTTSKGFGAYALLSPGRGIGGFSIPPTPSQGRQKLARERKESTRAPTSSWFRGVSITDYRESLIDAWIYPNSVWAVNPCLRGLESSSAPRKSVPAGPGRRKRGTSLTACTYRQGSWKGTRCRALKRDSNFGRSLDRKIRLGDST